MLFVAKGWIWTNDLWLMRPASYQTAPPRNIVISICLRLNLCLLKKTRFKESNQLIILNFLLLRYESLNKQTHNKTLINITNFFKICIFSGEGGSRTPEPHYWSGSFQDFWNKPLCHLSNCMKLFSKNLYFSAIWPNEYHCNSEVWPHWMALLAGPPGFEPG